MTSPATDHLIPVADLVDRPGASREVDLRLPVPEAFELPLAAVREPVRFDGVIESVVDGMLARGLVTADIALDCARCLTPVPSPARVDVVELFADPAALDDGDEVEEGYELRDGFLHLGALLRDALAAAIPYRPLCRADCAGLCAHCGRNLNEGACDCADEDLDPRWAALAELKLPDPDPDDGSSDARREA